MGRELKRKQAKKAGIVLKEEQINKEESPYSDIYKLLKTFGVLLLIVLAVHFITALVITKEIEWFKEKNKEEEKIQGIENSILAKNIFEQKEEEYYVYFYDFDEEDGALTNQVKSFLADKKVYIVDTADGFNSNYVTEEETGNSSATSLEELKVINPTLINVSGDVISGYYENKDNIENYLVSLAG